GDGAAVERVTVAVVDGSGGVGSASEEEWCRGSVRSGGGEHFWVRRKRSPESFLAAAEGGGRRMVVVGQLWGGREEWLRVYLFCYNE
nr:hypothetical protein [Tanacetum cinerariifolium]